MVTKIDLKKQLKDLYGTTKANGFVVVDVPEMNFLMVDGEGNPNTAQSFRDAIEALYALSYALKFMIKKGAAIDYGVMPLEALWWADRTADFTTGNKDSWKWTAMIMQPEWVAADLVDKARVETARKKELPSLADVRFQALKEGKSAQCLYLGRYADEAQTIEKLHQFISDDGARLRGRHHEIYLSDARRTDPAKLKTIIRQPMG